MSRAKWKNPFINIKLLSHLKNIESVEKKNNEIFTKSRNSIIIPQFVGKIFNIYNGKIFSKLQISEEMIGHKLGEFSPTRKKFSYKKKK